MDARRSRPATPPAIVSFRVVALAVGPTGCDGDMVLVPAGEFTMGSGLHADEPPHTVYLDDDWTRPSARPEASQPEDPRAAPTRTSPRRYSRAMRPETAPRQISTRIVRSGALSAENDDWPDTSPEERIEAVWDLTLACLGWSADEPGEPRLQRSHSRVQRQRR